MSFHHFKKSHGWDKMMSWPSHFHNGTSTLARQQPHTERGHRWSHICSWDDLWIRQCIAYSVHWQQLWCLPDPCWQHRGFLAVHKVVTAVKMLYPFPKHYHNTLLEYTLSTMEFSLCTSYFDIWYKNWLKSSYIGIIQLWFAFKRQANQCVIASAAAK